MKKLIFFVSEDWYFCSHRLPLAIAAKKAGYNVTVITRVNECGNIIEQAGLKLVPLNLKRRSTNVFSEMYLLIQLYKIYQNEKPDIVHHIALKPVLYGSMIALLTKVPRVVNALAGLGFLFSSRTYKALLMRPIISILFRLLLNRKNTRVILQNPDDVSLMCNKKIIFKSNVSLIRGSGVDTEIYKYHKEKLESPIVLLASRLLWDKGIKEFVEAARILKDKGIDARFVLVGEGDIENPSVVPIKQLQCWANEGVIEWWGREDDMPSILAQAHIVCLPSFYGEGVPKVLIEAASCGRPIVTTNTPGCKEIVKHNVNGFLVPIRESYAVAEAIGTLINSPDLRSKMGLKGRMLVKTEFSLEQVNQETLSVYRDLFH